MGTPKKRTRSASPQPPIEDLARALIDDPDKWLDTKNDQLGGEKPRDLVGTSKEQVLRNLLESIQHGSFS